MKISPYDKYHQKIRQLADWSFLLKFLFISDAKVIKLNVYRLRDSSLGFYHTGLEFDNREYTYCCGIGKTV